MSKKIGKMNAAEARKALEQTRARRAEIGERQAAIRPAKNSLRADESATSGAGPAWIEAYDAVDAERCAELEAEYQRLVSEATLLARRTYHLKERLKVAEAEEAKAAAPRAAKKLAKAATDKVSTAIELQRQADAARDEARADLQELADARKLAGDDAAGIALATFIEWLELRVGRDGQGRLAICGDTPSGIRPYGHVRRELRPVVALPKAAERAIADLEEWGNASARADVLDELIFCIYRGDEVPDSKTIATRVVDRNWTSRGSALGERGTSIRRFLDKRPALPAGG